MFIEQRVGLLHCVCFSFGQTLCQTGIPKNLHSSYHKTIITRELWECGCYCFIYIHFIIWVK